LGRKNEKGKKMTSADKINALEIILHVLKEQEKKLDSLLEKMENLTK
jgi:hypothetical protein